MRERRATAARMNRHAIDAGRHAISHARTFALVAIIACAAIVAANAAPPARKEISSNGVIVRVPSRWQRVPNTELSFASPNDARGRRAMVVIFTKLAGDVDPQGFIDALESRLAKDARTQRRTCPKAESHAVTCDFWMRDNGGDEHYIQARALRLGGRTVAVVYSSNDRNLFAADLHVVDDVFEAATR